MRPTLSCLAALVLSGCGFSLDSHVGRDPDEEYVIAGVEAYLAAHGGRPAGEITECRVATRTSSTRAYVCVFESGAEVTECDVAMGTSGAPIEDGGELRVDDVWGCRRGRLPS